MKALINTKLGESRGVAHIWLEGQKVGIGFLPHQRYRFDIDKDKKTAAIIADETGDRVVSVRNDKKRGIQKPLIQIRMRELEDVFGKAVMLRVTISEGRAVVRIHGQHQKSIERVQRFLRKIQTGDAIAVGSLFSGGGILDRALHEGMAEGGVQTYTKLAVEMEAKYLDAMMRNQREIFRDDSIVVESTVELMDGQASRGVPLEMMVMGIPCTGASRAGLTSNGISAAEFHETAGAAFFYALNLIGQCQPAIVLIENVPEYLHTTSMAVIRSVLGGWGYNLQAEILNGGDFGALEARKRMCLIATSEGLPAFSFSDIKKVGSPSYTVADILEDVPADDERWRDYGYLSKKEVRDKKAGKGFKRDLYTGSENMVHTIRRQYNKAGSCDQYLIHPDNPELSRLFTPVEHAAIKGIPGNLINGLCTTAAHEVLGQAVVFPVFTSVGRAIAQWSVNISNDSSGVAA